MRRLVTTPGQVAEILRSRRKSRRLSQAALAAELGLSQGSVSLLERDASALTLERFLLLAKLLGFEVILRDHVERPAKVDW